TYVSDPAVMCGPLAIILYRPVFCGLNHPDPLLTRYMKSPGSKPENMSLVDEVNLITLLPSSLTVICAPTSSGTDLVTHSAESTTITSSAGLPKPSLDTLYVPDDVLEETTKPLASSTPAEIVSPGNISVSILMLPVCLLS